MEQLTIGVAGHHKVWQAHCLACPAAQRAIPEQTGTVVAVGYAVVHQDGVPIRPRHCVFCGRLCVYTSVGPAA